MNQFSGIESSNKKNKNLDDNCETCHDFKDWFNSNQQKINSSETKSLKPNENLTENDYLNECPMLRNQFGRAAWSYLHTMAAYYPNKPTSQEQTNMKTFINTFAQFFPCKECAEDFKEEIKKSPPKVENSHELSHWFCEQHNIVNRKLGKDEFDCSKVFERWKLGKSTNPRCQSYYL